MQTEVDAYTHETKAMGGYYSAQMTIKDRQEDLEEWFENGLGRHIEVYNHALERIWEGFVNQVDLSLGALSITRGPLLSIANRCRVVYSTIGYDAVTNEPILGIRAVTPVADDTDSQTRYGIVEKVVSAGGLTAAIAAQVRDSYINEYRDPMTTERLGQGGGQQAVIHCLGYGAFLEAYSYYDDAPAAATQDLSVKMAAILDADPNGLFDSGNAEITENTTPASEQDDQYRVAWSIIKSLVAEGDDTFAKYVFGVYNDRKVIYEPVETDLTYRLRLSDAGQRVETLPGALVRPWDVKPGKWIFISDFLVGRTQPDDLQKDPRNIYIESVKFTAPYSVDVQGGRASTISQVLKRMGLGGS